MTTELIVEADGGSRGNPGEAAGGAVVIDANSGEVIAELGVYVGVATNNVAEYRGMLAGVGFALERHPGARILVRLDSKLVVEQMSGRWKIKHPDMRELATRAWTLLRDHNADVRFEWVPRDQNTRADRVANESMDARADITRIAR